MTIKGQVLEALPGCNFLVETEQGNIRAYLCGKMYKHRIQVVVGDKVEVDNCDGKLGRIVKRL